MGEERFMGVLGKGIVGIDAFLLEKSLKTFT